MSLPAPAPRTTSTTFGWGVVVIWGFSAAAYFLSQPLWLLLAFPLLCLTAPPVLQPRQQVQQEDPEWLATLSHELRTPLNVVLGLYPHLRDGLHDDAQAQALLAQMHQANQALLQAFEGLLNTIEPNPTRPSITQPTLTQTPPSQPSLTAGRTRATFTAAGADPNTQTQAQVFPAHLTQAAWRFLVVDDKPLNVWVLRRMLEKRFPHAEVLCVHDAQAAMKCLLNEPSVDAMLLDLRMPGIDGYALAQWVRQQRRASLAQMPMLAVTGDVRAEDALLRARCGINAVVDKPLNEQQLCECLCHVLSRAAVRGRV